MGIYRRTKDGKPGPYVVQYPQSVDPVSGRVKYTTRTVGYSKRLANRVFAKKMLEWQTRKHLGLETRKDYHFREVVDWYLGLPQTRSLKSLNKVREHCGTLKTYFGNILAREIKPYMVEEYQQIRLQEKTRRGTPYKPSSVNRELEVMKRLFNLAVRDELVDRNPCWKVKKLPEENARDRLLSAEEFRKLRAALPEHASGLLEFGYCTGMRWGEISGLTWDRVDLRNGFITLNPDDTKTGKPRRVYLIPQAFEVLERASKVRNISNNLVFTYKNMVIKSINRALKTALRETGIKNFTFHDLRHTFNTNMRRAGVPRVTIMKLTGHRTMSMYARYSTVDETDGKEAAGKLAEYLNGEVEITSYILHKKSGVTPNNVTP